MRSQSKLECQESSHEKTSFVKMESEEEMELRMRSCVRGYHGYQRVREGVVGENLECERETRNVKDRNAVVAKKAEKIISTANY